MNGIIDVEVYNRRGVKYKFSLYRNITIIRGCSGTGKTTLYRLVSNFEKEKEKSGVVVNCKVPVVTLTSINWEQKLNNIDNSIVFIDEGNSFIKSKHFVKHVKNSGNYFVLFTRENLDNLPSSINEMYEIKTKNKLHTLERLYVLNEFFYLDSIKTDYNIILTEDSKSGLQFFKFFYSSKQKKCISSNGNSSIYKKLLEYSKEKVFLFADGAAFAPYIDEVYKYKKFKNKNIVLCFPESFEYVILESGVIKTEKWKKEIKKPFEYINYKKCLTWEQYFIELIEKITANNNDGSKYSKDKIAQYYTKEVNAKKILKIIGLV